MEEIDQKPSSPAENTCFLCGVPASQLCPHCGVIVYCTAYHLAKHRVDSVCLPFRVATSPSLGRYLLATRDIEPLELIISEREFAVGPKQSTTPRCLTCLKPVQGEYSCPSCNFPFCSKTCADDPQHRDNECQVFPRFPNVADYTTVQPQYACVTPLRLLLTREQDPAGWQLVRLHKDHTPDRQRISPHLVQEEERTVVGLLLQGCGLAQLGYTQDEVRLVCSLLATHSVSCGEGGRAFYPTFAFMSHSCTYNARHVIAEDNTMRVYAQQRIPKGEEITITYTSLLTSSRDRQEKLRNLWFFTCCCGRCLDPTELGTNISAVACPSCPQKGYLLYDGSGSESWQCSKCGLPVPNTMVESLLSATRHKMGTARDGIEQHEDFLRLTQDLLHPNHYQVLITKRYLSQLYGRREGETEAGLQRKVDLCSQLLSIASILDPGLSQFRGLTLYDLFIGRLGLCMAAEGQTKPAGLCRDSKETLRSLLAECLACLRVETGSSHAGRAATSAAAYLDELAAAQIEN